MKDAALSCVDVKAVRSYYCGHDCCEVGSDAAVGGFGCRVAAESHNLSSASLEFLLDG